MSTSERMTGSIRTNGSVAQHGTGLAVVISAPSGAGKTSVLFEVLNRHPEIRFSVSATTREPRTGETDGVNYYYKTREEFLRLRDTNELLEWNEVHGNWYGTLREPVEQAIAAGETMILDTDVIGAFNIRDTLPEAVLVFLVPPSPEALEERLTRRNTETPERIKQRLDAYPAEIARMNDYDYIIVNDQLEEAVATFAAIIRAERATSTRMFDTLTAWRNFEHGRNEHER